MSALTKREHDCLYWAAQGKTSWEIGQILGICERTVNFHIANSCTKLAVHTRQAAIARALHTRLLATAQQPAEPHGGQANFSAAQPPPSAAIARSRPPAPDRNHAAQQRPPPRATRDP